MTELKLDRKKFRNNISYLMRKTKSSFFCPMVKANAYGVGDIEVVTELLEMGVKAVGVARVEEGLKLRRFFPEKDFKILVFHPILKEHVNFYQKSKLTPVVCSFRELEIFLNSSLNPSTSIHLKFDLGMNRFGFRLEDAEKLSSCIKEANVKVEALCGHFQSGSDWPLEEDQESASKESLKKLLHVRSEFFKEIKILHAPNSDAILRGEFEVGLRPGLCMYYSSKEDSEIKNALSLSSPIVEIRNIKKGEGVSYNSNWRAKEDSRIAVLPIGYADGLSRRLSNQISVGYKNKSFPLVGAICMDYCMVNIGLKSDLKVGDRLDFLGEDMVHLKSWAKLLDTIPYEIITAFGLRIKRSIG